MWAVQFPSCLSSLSRIQTYTISEMYGTDTLEGNVTLTYDGTPDMSKAGSTVIKISGTLANDNYTITYVKW